MKKILYISVNSKEESKSASKIVARKLIDEVLCQCKYKVPKCTENIYVFDGCEDDDLGEASNYKKEECCNDSSHKDEEKCCTENKEDIKCCEEIAKPNLKSGILAVSDDVEEATDEVQEQEYNVETLETKEKHKAQVCCEDINEFIKDCCPTDLKEKKHNCCETKHKHNHECCCGEEHDNDCCDGEHAYHHDSHCDEGHYYKNKCCDNEKNECSTDSWEECNEFVVEEIDLYKDYIPQLTHEFYECKNTLVDGPGPCYESLTHVQRKDIARIKELAIQFKEADIYVIAAPMWSLLFPAPLKQYLDCVILNGVTAEINEKCCKGTLDDKERKMVFVQSVGGELPILLKCKLDHSAAYLKDISRFLGISKFTELLVDGTGYTEHEKQDAISEAIKDIPHIAKCLIK
ncbi:MAG: NAD(P)H-dependent oxidoreductase [Sarcina sp.]